MDSLKGTLRDEIRKKALHCGLKCLFFFFPLLFHLNVLYSCFIINNVAVFYFNVLSVQDSEMSWYRMCSFYSFIMFLCNSNVKLQALVPYFLTTLKQTVLPKLNSFLLVQLYSFF